MLSGDDFCVQLLNSPRALLSILEGFSPNCSFQQKQDALDLVKGQEGSTAGGLFPLQKGLWGKSVGCAGDGHGMGWDML